MIEAPAPPDEEARLQALRRLGLLDAPPSERFDRITRVGQRALGVPITLVTLVDANRQWFASCLGMDAGETPPPARPPGQGSRGGGRPAEADRRGSAPSAPTAGRKAQP